MKQTILVLLLALISTIAYAQRLESNGHSVYIIHYGPMFVGKGPQPNLKNLDLKVGSFYTAFLATNSLAKMLVIRPLLVSEGDFPENPYDDAFYAQEIYSGLGRLDEKTPEFRAAKITHEVLSKYNSLVIVGYLRFEESFSLSNGVIMFRGYLIPTNDSELNTLDQYMASLR